MVGRLVKSGNSLTLVMPPEVVKALGLDESTPLRMEVDGQQLTITPANGSNGNPSSSTIAAAAEKSHQRYAEAYKRLAE